MEVRMTESEGASVSNEMLGTAPILPLLVRFATPSIISMLVNSLYNIVDQIFIGQNVGYLGNGATSVCFPFVTISMAVALLNGDGSVALFSLLQGRKENEHATRTIGTGLLLSVLIGCVMLVVFQTAITPFLYLFGSTEAIYPYAYTYARITLMGIPLVAISIFISGIVRADGNPSYAMLCMVSGCIANVILDAWFVMGLGWGVRGAALATVIGQMLNFILCIAYLRRFRTFRLKREHLKLEFTIIRQICALGVSSLITQLSSTIVIILGNKLLIKYGELSRFGADIPLAAFGIVMKCNQILFSILMGMGIGSQPIVGYNYGAELYDRVRKTYLTVVAASTVVAIVGWCIFQFCTMPIVSLFGQESALYNEFAVLCFRVFLGFIFLGGFTVNTGIFFQAIGKARIAMLLSLTRQILYYIPAVLILTELFGLMGCLYVGPVSELLATLTCLFFAVREMHWLKVHAGDVSAAPAQGE